MVKIGLEVHVALKTRSKLFCPCPVEKAPPNQNTCEICLGHPGTRPLVNQKAINLGIMVGLAVNCKINRQMCFSRKSYFYPDMSKNFQITQYEMPLAEDGYVYLGRRRISIWRVHLEEDPARLIHKDTHVLVDYNRAGVPLVEIVSGPDLRTANEAKKFLKYLRSILEHLGIVDVKKEGSMRVDANVSVGKARVELKNITGFKGIYKAISFEILRQKRLLRKGKKIRRETRYFVEGLNITKSAREKEFAEEYGYIFEPDIPPIYLSRDMIKKIGKKMPELPEKRVSRLMAKYGLAYYPAHVIVYEGKEFADFFEETCKKFKDYKTLADYLQNDVLRCLNWVGIGISASRLKPDMIKDLLVMIQDKKITRQGGRKILEKMVVSGKPPLKIAKELDLEQIKDQKKIKKIVNQVYMDEKKAVKDYLKGNQKAIHHIMGAILRKTRTRADARIAFKILKDLLKKKI